MASFAPSCVSDFWRLESKKKLQRAAKGDPVFELLTEAITDRSLRMSVLATPKQPHFNTFKSNYAFFAPGEEGFKHYKSIAGKPESIEYVKNGERLNCRYFAGTKSISTWDFQVEMFFTCPSLAQLERKAIGKTARKPAKPGKTALERTL